MTRRARRSLASLSSKLGGDDVGRTYSLSHMKLAGVRIGLLIKFNNKILKDGIRRCVL
jgi:hypothetical protein